MAVLLGIVIGFILGAWLLSGMSGGLAGALVGFIVTMAVQSRSRARVAQRTSAQARAAATPEPATAQRLAAIEERLTALEQGNVRVGEAAVVTPPPLPEPEAPTTPSEIARVAAAPSRLDVPLPETTARSPWQEPIASPAPESPRFVRTPEGTFEPVTPEPAASVPPPLPASRPPVSPAPSAPSRLWAWFTGGNALTRIGVVALFFGVGFLLKYLAEFVTIPIEVKLAGVALAGAAVMLLGIRLARTRPGYGLSLQGAGAGILYLTTFAALRQYDVLSISVAFVLLVAIAALTVWRAVRADSQALAGLAIAGGFLAPFLVTDSLGEPTRLFGYFLVLNAAILALAWVRAWRALNVLGFLFTLGLCLFWGEQYYRPEHFATVEPFLVLFFAFYLAIAILFAKREALAARAPVDAMLVFGVPAATLGLQAALVRDTPTVVAWSAFAMAVVYGGLALALYRGRAPGFALLARAFFAIAVLCVTVAIPFAADPQWTSGWWALQAIGVYWMGCQQKQALPRAFAVLLQLAAALAFAVGGFEPGVNLFLNATFLGSTFIAVAAIATAYIADRHRDTISRNEIALIPLLIVWGVCWWYGAGALELVRALPRATAGNAVLGYVVASVALALVLRRWLRWSRLAWFGVGILPVMAIAAFADWQQQRTTLLAYGWLVWPLAWAMHWRVLRAAESLRADEALENKGEGVVASLLRVAHAASAIAIVSWLAWEASEWVGREFPAATVWLACAAALPAIAYLFLVAPLRGANAWPLSAYREAYTVSGGTALAALLAVWFLIVNLTSPGSAKPLPYVPILNPLDLTLLAALAALTLWARGTMRVAERTLFIWFGAALFLLVNAMVFRAVHQWLDVPWRLTTLLSSKPLQAALTLTWSATALPLMLVATRRSVRPLWMVGAFLLAVVVVKLFVIDLGSLSGLPRIVAFLGVGVLLLLIGYLAPLPPATIVTNDAATR